MPAASTSDLTAKARRFPLYIPLFLAVFAAYYAGFSYFGVTMYWKGIGLGALGWILALVLRTPFILLFRKMPKEKAAMATASISGPTEELIRLAFLLLTVRSLPWVASLGLGWAGIEIIFSVVQGVAIAQLVQRTDEKAAQAREMLAQQGTLDASPLVGVVERIFASAIHMGFGFILATNPWLAVLTVPVHSLVDMTIPYLSGRKASLTIIESVNAVVGIVAFGVGLWMIVR